MRWPGVLAITCCALTAAAYGLRVEPPKSSAFVLADERVRFDAKQRPEFTSHQLRYSGESTRSGLARWAATPQGSAMVARLDAREFRIAITEDESEDGAGRAPQPGLATLVAANDHNVVKSYQVILNPTFGVSRVDAVPGYPASAADMMAVACAGEMLHVAFYARGISLPHHKRPDFQREWREVAAELGYPSLQHGDDETARYLAER